MELSTRRLETVEEGEVMSKPRVSENTAIYDEQDLDRYYPARCGDCGWVGISSACTGGGPLADTGDYEDIYCPKCDAPNIDEDPDPIVVDHDTYVYIAILKARIAELEAVIKRWEKLYDGDMEENRQ